MQERPPSTHKSRVLLAYSLLLMSMHALQKAGPAAEWTSAEHAALQRALIAASELLKALEAVRITGRWQE